jgi:hypothetical protein
MVVEPSPAVTPRQGYTGSRASSIAASLVLPVAAATSLSFHHYGVPVPFPTNISVPCGGTALLIFTPVPGSRSARSYSLTITFANLATAS